MRQLSLFISIIVCMFAAVLFASAAPAFPDAIEQDDIPLQVQPFASGDSRIEVLELPGYEENPYLLFLPAGCDRNHLSVSFSGDFLKIDGRPIVSGEPTDALSEDGIYTVETPEGAFGLRVMGSDNLPSIYIETGSGSLSAIHADKSCKEPAVLTIAENGAVTAENVALEYIKGRGNSSWQSNEKRSYNIRFEEETGLLGMPAAKKWALISNNMDETLMRNAIAYSAAQLTRLPYTVDFAFIDLYINGMYRGNYLVCEKIEIGENRIAAVDLDDANRAVNPGVSPAEIPRRQTHSHGGRQAWWEYPAEPDSLSGGYLLEFEYPDAFTTEKSCFMTEYGTCLVLHSPEYATKGEIDYISSLYNELEKALLAEDGRNRAGKHYSEYLDMDSMIDGLLLYDFTSNQDGGFTSWYIYLPDNSQKFHMGPVWDFDQSMENASETPESITVSARAMFDRRHGYKSRQQKSFLALLLSHREVVDRLAERFAELQPAFSGPLNKNVAELFSEISASAGMDRIRWGYHADQLKDAQLTGFVPERTAVLHWLYTRLDAEIGELYEAIEEAGGYEESRPATPSPVLWVGIAMPVLIAVLLVFLRKKKEKNRKKEP